MIDITKLKEDDIGKWVEYSPLKNHIEIGRIKSWNDKWVFVVYGCCGQWFRYQEYSATATAPKNLTFANDYVLDSGE